MKKRIRFLVLMFLLLITLIIIVTTASKLEAVNKGHWLYDREGEKVGCKSPGNDCEWS